MKKFLIPAILALTTTGALAAGKGYQVTGPVTAINDASISVKKGSEVWTIAKDGSTKIPADVKVGDKVTVYYTMTAAEVESKGPAKEAKADSKKEAKADAKAAASAAPAASGASSSPAPAAATKKAN